MKKFILVLAITFAAINGTVFAQGTEASSDEYYSIKNLITTDLFENSSVIKEKSASLSTAQKVSLYDDTKKMPWLAFGLNTVVGFGIGSYVNGDKVGGTNQLVGEILGYSFLGIGYGLEYASYFKIANNVASGSNTAYDSTSEILMATGVGLMVGGGIALTAYHIYGIVRAFTFTANYNEELQKSLGITSNQVTVVPVLDFKNQNYGFAGVIQLQ
jgi:ElaB/YqjD/DUF883 family membrane-anchored ribosome-binding protein